MTSEDQPITELLDDLNAGNPEAADALMPAVYEQLRRLAARAFQHERPDHTLQPTALVHETYLRLIGPGKVEWKSRAHFFNCAARSMRRILKDRARAHAAEKRFGGQQRIDLDKAVVFERENLAESEALHDALDRFEAEHERQAQVVELRYFAGLTIDETAEVLGVGKTTVKEDWDFARAWLRKELEGGIE